MGFLGIDPNQTIFPSSEYESWGLTKREYFAAMMLHALWAGRHWSFDMENCDLDDAAEDAVALADALIKKMNGE